MILSNPMVWFSFASFCFVFAWSRFNYRKDIVKKVAGIRGSINEKVKEINGGRKNISCDDISKIYSFLSDTDRVLGRIEFFVSWSWNTLVYCSGICFLIGIISISNGINLKDELVVKMLGLVVIIPFILSVLALVVVANWDSKVPDEKS